jgi:alpha-amylase/alpha-mannosidase (GH57 family)
MIYWAPLLHFYQPTNQTHWVLRKICEESYRPLVKLFHELPHAKVTVNINGALTELLDDHGMSDVIAGLRDLCEKGRLEFTGSAKYHAILPLIGQDEMLRQIVLNNQTNKQFFGDCYSPQGFFPPEMAYSHDVVKPILETGHKWVILSGVACPVDWPNNVVNGILAGRQKLVAFFRDDILSNKVSFRDLDASGFLEQLRQLRGNHKDIYVITAMDAETFGHHIKNWEKLFLKEVYEAIEPIEAVSRGVKQLKRLVDAQKEIFSLSEKTDKLEIEVVTISQLLELFPPGQSLEPRPSSWSTTLGDIKDGNPYPLWNGKGNALHQLQWQHLKIAMDMTYKAMKVATTEVVKLHADLARGLLDKALQSDQFWWASRRPMWDINLIHQGLLMQREVILNAYKAIKMSDLSEDEKMEYYYRVVAGRDLRSKITDQLLLYG